MSASLFEEMKRYVRFDAEDERNLRECAPFVTPCFQRTVEDFYARIQEHPDALAVFRGDLAIVERLKRTLVLWLEQLFAGPWDEAYFELRCHIGRRHVRIQLPQQYNFTAMSVIREHLVAAVVAHPEDAERRDARIASINKMLDLELAIMLHTYQEDYAAQLQRRERLATFGQLTSTIGHELRNPLGVVQSSVFLMRKRAGEDPVLARHLDRIENQVERSTRIIGTMLDLVRNRPPTRTRISPAAVAERAAHTALEDHGFMVELDIEPGVADFAVDTEQLHQALGNLLSNAIQAAGKSGTVRLGVHTRGDEVELAVSDSGSGVDPSVRDRLFEPLVTAKDEGVGLGLALCRKIVEAHGGVLALSSTSELTGATFVIRLRAASTANDDA